MESASESHPGGDALEAAILELLADRAAGATICPSEVARKVCPDDWRERMEDVRQAAGRLVAADRLEILQGGSSVDLSRARGPIRLRAK